MDNLKNTIDFNDWNLLFRVGAISSLIIALLIPIAAVVFLLYPPPVKVEDYFAFYQQSILKGLLSLDLIMLITQLLMIPIFLGLYIALKQINNSLMAIGTVAGLIAIVLFLHSREATFGMIYLSQQYNATVNTSEQNTVLAAGHTLLTIYNGTAFHLSYNIGQLAGILISIVMLRSNVFNKTTAYAGILGNAIGFGLYLPVIGIYVSLFSVVGLEVWFILLAGTLYRLSRRQ